MAVRIADTLKQQNNLTTFPVAYGEDIWLDKNKGSGTKNYSNLQEMFNNNELGGNNLLVTIMPTASETYLDTVLLYIGETGTYKYGTYYKCISDGETPPTYSWVDAEIGGGTKIFYGTMDDSSIIRPRVMNISNSPVNEGEPFYTNVTNSLEVFKIVANAMYADIDASRTLTPYMGHATAYTTDESGEPNMGVTMYIATACWGANGRPYIRMRIFADNGCEYRFARSQDGVFTLTEASSLENITPIKVNVNSNSGAWAYKSGKVVNVNFAALVTLNQTTPAGTILYSGFPKPALDIVRFGLIDARTTDVVTGMVQINSAGNLVADGQGLKTNTAYWGSFTYLTDE